MVENDIFIPNSARYLAEHYMELAGKHVAWSFDGKTVFATAPSLAELYATMTDAGREDYVTDFIDPVPVVVAPAIPMSRAS